MVYRTKQTMCQSVPLSRSPDFLVEARGLGLFRVAPYGCRDLQSRAAIFEPEVVDFGILNAAMLRIAGKFAAPAARSKACPGEEHRWRAAHLEGCPRRLKELVQAIWRARAAARKLRGREELELLLRVGRRGGWGAKRKPKPVTLISQLWDEH